MWSGTVTDTASDPPRRYLALWLPFLPTDRQRWRHGRSAAPDEGPHLLVEKIKGALLLAAVDARATGLGLRPGLTLADASARVPHCTVTDADPAADAALLDRLADGCDRWTPLVATDPPDGLLLDITGCAHLAGGEEVLRTEICARLAKAGFATRAAIAGTPDAARALARFGTPGTVPQGGDAQAVRPLPIAALGLAPERTVALARAGLRRIGDLADRPAAPLAARFGTDLPVRLRRVLGQQDTRLTPRRTLPVCSAERHFLEPLVRLQDVEHSLALLAAEAVAVLERRGMGGRVFEAAFFRTDGGVRRVEVAAGRPLRDAAAVLRLFRERLAALADPLDLGFGFDLIRLGVPMAERLGVVQGGLDNSGQDSDAVADLVDRLVARFGRDRVLRFTARDTHDPARAARRVPADAMPAQHVPWPVPVPGAPPTRPTHLFDPPQPIETLAEVPDGPPARFRWRQAMHEVTRSEGPERIAPEWWRPGAGTATRDYFRVEDTQGRRFWVFREGLYDRETDQPRWFLHGLFP